LEEDELSDNSFTKPIKKQKAAPKAAASKKKGVSVKPKPKSRKDRDGFKTVPYDSVTIPMGDKSIYDKLLSWRYKDDGSEDILVKYKVKIKFL
jgi:hypothetical protein